MLFIPVRWYFRITYLCIPCYLAHDMLKCEGGVCLNILREDWRPVLDVNAVIYGLIQLFGHDVNSEEPLNREAAALLQTDRTQVCSHLIFVIHTISM